MIQSIVLLLAVVAIIFFKQKRKQAFKKQHDLKPRQRGVNIMQQWLDPVIELVIVGGVLWIDLRHGLLPWISLFVGLVIGAPLGIVRGRFMYVSSISKTKIVVERNAAEISIFAVLIAIKLAANKISAHPTSTINLIAIALLGIGLASSVGRVIYITLRHYDSSPQSNTLPSSKNNNESIQ